MSEGEKEESRDGVVAAARAHVLAVVAQSANVDRSRVTHHEDETFATFERLAAALAVADRPASESTGDSAEHDREPPPQTLPGIPLI